MNIVYTLSKYIHRAFTFNPKQVTRFHILYWIYPKQNQTKSTMKHIILVYEKILNSNVHSLQLKFCDRQYNCTLGPGDTNMDHRWAIVRLSNDSLHIWFDTLRPRLNGRHFADDIFKCIFLNENAWIAIKISLKFVPKGPISNIPALVQIMAWRRPGDKPLSEPMMASLPTHICVTRPQWVKPLSDADLLSN